MERRPRVTFVAPAVPGREERNGFSSRLHDLLLALLQVADVDLFVPRSSGVDSPAAVDYWRQVEGVTLHLALESEMRSPIVHRTRRVGHHLFGRLPRWSAPRRAPELAGHLEGGGADILCLHLPVTAHLAQIAPADVPVVAVLEEGLERGILAPRERTWFHSIAARREARRVKRLYRRTSERAAVVVAISTEERERLGEAGIDPDHIVVVPLGIDVSYFAPDPTGAEPDLDVAVFGEFRFERNLAPARAAAAWAAVHHPALRWGFVGDIESDDAEALRATGATVSGRVDDLRANYATTKVVLVPAVAVTGVKTTLLQAWAMGKPAVSTPQSAVGVPAVDRENVLIGRTTAELVELCAQLAESPTRREQLGAAGRQTVLEHLDGARIAAEFAQLVTSLASVR
ncbi:MAG TPA: glycosyltransferase family 4 protein [Acidimicrobiia bacterium]|jgi:glycosyltransferase involved in cell wall biosynthesis